MYTNIVVTQRVFCPRKPVASKQPTCIESEQEVNKVNGKLTEAVRAWCPGRHHLPLSLPALLSPRETSHTHRGPQKRLERFWGPRWGRADGSVGQLSHESLVSLDAVDQPSQGDVDPARRLLILEDPDVGRGLGDDVASQLNDLVGADVGAEAAHQRTRVLIGSLLVAIDVAEHESRHGLGLEVG